MFLFKKTKKQQNKNMIIENQQLKGRIKIEYLDKYRVQFEVDNDACKFLIKVLTELMEDPKLHHLDFDSNTGYDCGFMTKDSLSLIINNRDKYK